MWGGGTAHKMHLSHPVVHLLLQRMHHWFFFFSNKLCEPDRCFPLHTGQNWAILTNCVDFSRQTPSDKTFFQQCFPAHPSPLPARSMRVRPLPVSSCLPLLLLFAVTAPGCWAQLHPPMLGNITHCCAICSPSGADVLCFTLVLQAPYRKG